jgi:hypothetical protein
MLVVELQVGEMCPIPFLYRHLYSVRLHAKGATRIKRVGGSGMNEIHVPFFHVGIVTGFHVRKRNADALIYGVGHREVSSNAERSFRDELATAGGQTEGYSQSASPGKFNIYSDLLVGASTDSILANLRPILFHCLVRVFRQILVEVMCGYHLNNAGT